MRRFLDNNGREWEVTIGKESWGTLVLLLVGPSGDDVRKVVLTAETALAASAELDAMSDDTLRACLESATRW